MFGSQCFHCRHYSGWNGLHRCPAFPDGIPQAFLDNLVPHAVKHPDGNGFRFEAAYPAFPAATGWFRPFVFFGIWNGGAG